MLKMIIPISFKHFLKQSSGYVLCNLLEKLVPFILLPIIVRKISVEEYGEYSFFLTLESVLIPIISLNLSNCIYREYYKNKNNLSFYISNLFYGYLIIGLIMLIPYLIIVFVGDKFIGFPHHLYFCLFLTSFLFHFCDIISLICRVKQKVLYYGGWQISKSLLLLLLMIASLYISENYTALVYARATTFIVVFITAIVVLSKKRMLWKRFDKELFIYMINFSLPTVIYSLSSFVFSFSDRFFIRGFLGNEMLGIYSGIYQLSAAISILVTALNAAWMPWLFDKLSKNEENGKREVVKISYAVICGFLIVGIIWGSLFPFLSSKILTTEYSAYSGIAWFFIFAFVMHGIYCIVSPYTYYTKKTKVNAKIGMISAVFNVILNFILTPLFGIVGPALSLFFTWFIQALLFFVYSNYYYPMPWRLKNDK